jgi:hypothetical protein
MKFLSRSLPGNIHPPSFIFITLQKTIPYFLEKATGALPENVKEALLIICPTSSNVAI